MKNTLICFSFFILFWLSATRLSSQSRDTVLYKDYWILLNGPASRTVGWDLGIERIMPFNEKLSYASQLSVRGGKWFFNSPESYTNPRFISVCLQPFHLLVGRQRLKFETGLAVNLQVYRVGDQQFAPVRSFAFFQDMLVIIYSVGLRYTFKKPQLSLKLIAGPGYGINLQSGFSQFIQSQTLEMGVSWRLRNKIKRYPYR